MIKIIITTLMMLAFSSAKSMPDCSDTDEFDSSTYAMLVSELMPVDIESPEADALIRFNKGDYRLLAYGEFEGIKIPGIDLLEENRICRLGVRVFSGMTDSFESRDHLILVESIKKYINAYNRFLIDRIHSAGERTE